MGSFILQVYSNRAGIGIEGQLNQRREIYHLECQSIRIISSITYKHVRSNQWVLKGHLLSHLRPNFIVIAITVSAK